MKYFVSYFWTNKNASGHGTCEVTRSKPVIGTDDINGLAKDIEESNGLGKIIILFWRQFETEKNDKQ